MQACKTCGRPAGDPYANVTAREACADACHGELYAEARDWLADVQTSYDVEDARDIVNHWPAPRVVAAVDRRYDGGWSAFVEASAPLYAVA